MNNAINILSRSIETKLLKSLTPNKVIVILGPRRIGKTVLLNSLLSQIAEPYIFLNGEDIATHELLNRRSVQNYQNLLGNNKLLIIDEAQNIADIGRILKLMIDSIKGLKIIVTGSSAFDMANVTGEPLTGRKKTFYLFPLSEKEYRSIENPTQHRDNLEKRLIYGNYPELLSLSSTEDRVEYLNEILNSYLLKDILTLDKIRNASKIFNLLRLIAFQVGSEVSYSELGNQLSISKNTVERYLDLLSKVFVLHKLGGYSGNLRKEVTKSNKWYFYDNGLRNILIANLNPLSLRNDVGQLWENYIISERVKQQTYDGRIVNRYFWRTYDGQEIDLIEEKEGRLDGFEIKWGEKKKAKIPPKWAATYNNSTFKIVNQANYYDWLVDE
jgi:predicted AAA+ superfamily ATPase